MQAAAKLLVVLAGASAAACGGPFGGTADVPPGRRPERIGTFVVGAGRAGASAPAAGIVALHPPTSGRIRINGGKFVMGSTPREMQRATDLCAREPFGSVCANSARAWNPGPA